MRYSAAHRHSSGNGVLGIRKRAAVGGVLKRGLDVVVATVLLILLAPIFFVTSVLMRLLFGAPILVAERMVGLGGEVFTLFKFRVEDSSSKSASPWFGAVGTALRASGIDKLPHLYNVVRGDMSLVGQS